MKRKTYAGQLTNLCRRLYLDAHGTLKGFGKISANYRRSFHPDPDNVKKYGGYAAMWNEKCMKDLRALLDSKGIK